MTTTTETTIITGLTISAVARNLLGRGAQIWQVIDLDTMCDTSDHGIGITPSLPGVTLIATGSDTYALRTDAS